MSVEYTITYTIASNSNARTGNDQYVKIKGTNGQTEENMCDADFNVFNKDVVCSFKSEVNIGYYTCVALRTGGSDGLDLAQVNI